MVSFGKSGLLSTYLSGSIHGPASFTPPVSCATETISKFLSFSCSYTACQPGRSKRHPHHEAHVTRKTFLPRKSESECGLPLMSGRVKFGACRELNPCRWSARRPKYQVSSAASCATG